MIIVVSALSYSRYCLTTDQLAYRRATQITEKILQMKHNIFWESQLAGGKPVGYLQAQPKDL